MLSVTGDTGCVFSLVERRGEKPEFMVESKTLLRGTQFLEFHERNLTLQDHYRFQKSFCNLLIMSKDFKELTKKLAWEFLLKEHINILSDIQKCIVSSQHPCLENSSIPPCRSLKAKLIG